MIGNEHGFLLIIKVFSLLFTTFYKKYLVI